MDRSELPERDCTNEDRIPLDHVDFPALINYPNQIAPDYQKLKSCLISKLAESGQIPKLIDNEAIGSGVFGKVFKGIYPGQDKPLFAAKFTDELPNEELFKGLALNELRSQVPNFAYYYDHFDCDSELENNNKWCIDPERNNYILMEYIEGKTLYDYAKKSSERDVLTAVVQLLNALNAAYIKYQYCHGDLHVDNVIVQRFGERKTVGIAAEDGPETFHTNAIPVIIDQGMAYLAITNKETGQIKHVWNRYAPIPYPQTDIIKLFATLIMASVFRKTIVKLIAAAATTRLKNFYEHIDNVTKKENINDHLYDEEYNDITYIEVMHDLLQHLHNTFKDGPKVTDNSGVEFGEFLLSNAEEIPPIDHQYLNGKQLSHSKALILGGLDESMRKMGKEMEVVSEYDKFMYDVSGLRDYLVGRAEDYNKLIAIGNSKKLLLELKNYLKYNPLNNKWLVDFMQKVFAFIKLFYETSTYLIYNNRELHVAMLHIDKIIDQDNDEFLWYCYKNEQYQEIEPFLDHAARDDDDLHQQFSSLHISPFELREPGDARFDYRRTSAFGSPMNLEDLMTFGENLFERPVRQTRLKAPTLNQSGFTGRYSSDRDLFGSPEKDELIRFSRDSDRNPYGSPMRDNGNVFIPVESPIKSPVRQTRLKNPMDEQVRVTRRYSPRVYSPKRDSDMGRTFYDDLVPFPNKGFLSPEEYPPFSDDF